MRILGINAGRAVPPRCDPTRQRRLADGSSAFVDGGRIICATPEERHQRVKYAGGFRRSAPVALAQGRCRIEDVDAIGISTCCDTIWTNASDRLDALVEELAGSYSADAVRHACAGRVHAVDHHDSHAMLAFVGSGFRRGLVCVFDGFGNRLDQPDQFDTGSDWWRGSFERQTTYLGEWIDGHVHLERVNEGARGKNEVGLAELYRSVTHFMGWPSYQFAGKTMALASYGNPNRFRDLDLILAGQHEIRVNVSNIHNDPIGQISQALEQAGYCVPEDIKRPAQPQEAFLCDLAASVQKQLEDALIDFVGGMADHYGVSNIAFAGGLALNCVALGKLARARSDLRIYVPPAPGDTGQGLGNALWLAYSDQSPVYESVRPKPINSAALGTNAEMSAQRLESLSLDEAHAVRCYDHIVSAALARAVATQLAQGKIIGMRVGRAECGPRALGQCSILADPRTKTIRHRVNEIKHRELFRPFAASVRSEDLHACFPNAPDSPFMSFAAEAADAIRRAAPGVVHVDGTTRYQTVDRGSGLLRSILDEFYQLSGVPLLLNTSFNLSGEPMAETADDALDMFNRSTLDALILDDVLITRQRTGAFT